MDDDLLFELAEFGKRTVCPIVARFEGRTGIGGTGVFIRHLNRIYLVTAKHVVSSAELPNHLPFLELPAHPGGPQLYKFRGCEVVESRTYDVAVLRLPRQELARKVEANWNVIDADVSRDVMTGDDDKYCIFGYPNELTHLDGIMVKSKPFFVHLRGASTPEQSSVADPIDPSIDFFLQRPKSARVASRNVRKMAAAAKEAPLPDLHGISGCPVWRINDSRLAIPPSARLTLVGVETGVLGGRIWCRRWAIVSKMLREFDDVIARSVNDAT